MTPRPGRLRARLAAVAVLAGASVLAGAPAALAEDTAFTFADAAITAPVGMATDHVNKRYWAIQASSGTLTIQAFDEAGGALGAVSSRDRISNVQALAFAAQQLYIGDVGGSRERVTILQMDRPLPGTEINKSSAVALAYPDGAHDAAAIMANADGRLFVVTRGKEPGIYEAPADLEVLPPWGTTAAPVNKLARVADAPADVTDATVLVDGRLALRTAAEGVTVLDPTSYRVLGTQEVTATQRGRGLTQSLDQKVLLAGAGSDGSVAAVAIPGPAPAQPTAPSSRRSSETASNPEENRSFAQPGTMVALVAAVGAGLLAAAVVLVKR